MRIGELARRAGASTRSLRYYEEQGLLSPARDANGYREYDEVAVTTVRNVLSLLAQGLPTKDIVRFGGCLLDRDLSVEPLCDEAVATYQGRRDAVAERIDELTDQHRRLNAALRGSAG